MRIHQTLEVTPAMAAGATSKLWEMSDGEGARGLGSAAKDSTVFDVSYHATFYFFWVQTTLRCQTNNFLGYDFN